MTSEDHDGDDAHSVEEDAYDALLDLRQAIVQWLLPELARKHVYPLCLSPEIILCFGTRKYLLRDVSGNLVLSHRIVILQTAIFISLSLSFKVLYVDKTLRDGEPRVWKELNAALDAEFGVGLGSNHDGMDSSSVPFCLEVNSVMELEF